MSGRIRYDSSASEDMVGSGREFLSATQGEVDQVESAGRGVEGSLEGGAGAEQVGAVQKILRSQGEEQLGQTQNQINTDNQVRDINDAGKARMAQFFGNNG